MKYNTEEIMKYTLVVAAHDDECRLLCRLARGPVRHGTWFAVRGYNGLARGVSSLNTHSLNDVQVRTWL